MNVKSFKVKENTFKQLFSIEGVIVFGSREQAETYAKIMFIEDVKVVSFDKSRLDFIKKIDLDKLEFNVSINFEGAYMCRYEEVILFDFDIVGESVLIKFEDEVALSIPKINLEEFPDFIVLLDTI